MYKLFQVDENMTVVAARRLVISGLYSLVVGSLSGLNYLRKQWHGVSLWLCSYL